jgi:NAD-dependent SIR2 family protein deacetylase
MGRVRRTGGTTTDCRQTRAARPRARRRNGVGTSPTDDHKEAIVADKGQMYNGYCVKCKEKRDFEGHVEVSKTGMNMAKGKCPVCGTTVNRILGKAKV